MEALSPTSPPLPRSIEEIRSEFPILSREVNGVPLAYLDNSATAQKPEVVIEAMADFLRTSNANVHRGVHTLSEEATALYEGARGRVARLIGAAPGEVIFTRNATEAINVAAQAWGEANLQAGDTVLLTEMEHHSNIVPWYLAARRAGATLDWVPVDEEGRIIREAFTEALARGPKAVAITHVSNVLGTVNPVDELVSEARGAGALTLIDGTQAAPRIPLDVASIGADFYAITGHKLYGPTGVGVLHGRREVLDAMEPFEGGGSMISKVGREQITWASPPARFEAGTPMIAEAIGLGVAAEWVEGLGLAAIGAHERAVASYALDRLDEVPGLTVFGPPAGDDREGIVSFELEGVHPHDVAQILDRHGVAVRAGHHCNQILMDRLGVPALTRASFAVYNTTDEVDRMVEGLEDCRRIFSDGD
jgi:cysteine desulfurase/selenocysteine lyase